MGVTISTHNGSNVAIEHNRRNRKVTDKEHHIDPHGEHESWGPNISLRKAYDRLFGKAVAEYNAKQTRADRQIDSYYKKVRDHKQKHLCYELIIGIYGKNPDGSPICSREVGKEILHDFVKDWKRRNPHLVMVGAYYHADEQGEPHCHIDYIPVATNCKSGMSRQNALVQALGQMGFEKSGKETAQIQWQRRENEHLEQLCVSRGLEVDHPREENRKHLETTVFQLEQDLKQAQQQVQTVQAERDTLRAQNSISQEIQAALQQPDRPIQAEYIPAKKNLTGKIVEPEAVKISREDFDWLRQRATITNAIKNAWDRLQRYGRQLWSDVDINARVQAAEQRAEKAKQQTRVDAITIQELQNRAKTAEATAQAQEQFMKRLGIWQRFLQHTQAKKLSQQQSHHRSR